MSSKLEIPKFKDGFEVLSYEHEGRVLGDPHWHKEIEIIYSHKGMLNLGVNNKVIPLKEGEMYIIDSGYTHYFLSSPENMRYVVQFDIKHTLIPRVCEYDSENEVLFSSIEPHSKNWNHETRKKATEIFLTIMKELRDEKYGYEHLVISKLLELTVLLHREVPKGNTRKRKNINPITYRNTDVLEKLNTVYQYLEDNFTEEVNLADVSSLVGYNEQYFTRFFKKHTGKTFIQYLNELKVQRAQWILSQEIMPMADVAFKSGFKSIKTFHHVFKDQVGMSPGEYRKSKLRNTMLKDRKKALSQ